MKKLIVAVALALAAPAAHAEGIDITWSDCVGTGAEETSLCFRCDGTFDETYNLVLQFKLPATILNFVGMAAYIDFQNDTGTPLSPFWRYEVGGCNNPGTGIKGIAMSDDIRLLPGCAGSFADPWGGDGSMGAEGIAAYGVDFRRPGNGYFILGDARYSGGAYPPLPLIANLNYYAFHLVFNNRNRTRCAGCADRGTLVFQKLELESNDGTPRVDLVTPDKRGQIVWVNRSGCNLPVPVRAQSWAQIKSLYR